MKITVVGAGFVGLSNAVALAKHNMVTVFDINADRVNMINSGVSPFEDTLINDYLADLGPKGKMHLHATTNSTEAYSNPELVIVAVPTNYNEETGEFDTAICEKVIGDAIANDKTPMILVKSTIPIGFTDSMIDMYQYDWIYFSPEFLREGTALYDCLNPDRIIVSTINSTKKDNHSYKIMDLYNQASEAQGSNLFMAHAEAEAVKLFSNSYLAMRVAFFNELDTYAMVYGLNAENIINGVSRDPRIGPGYNNPSFGYGGYCLPKDTKQLESQFDQIGVTCPVLSGVIDSNDIRLEDVYTKLLDTIDDFESNFGRTPVIGVYRLSMKAGSDNWRESTTVKLMELMDDDFEIVIHEPSMDESERYILNNVDSCTFENDLFTFGEKCDIIIANRPDNDIMHLRDKLFTRGLYNGD
jgi:UDPglucose 6-dehydrogenase